jgi:hypothetical protein
MPIQQHPLPQDISSYKFRLIGDMTVRQFIFIAVAIVLTILIHNSPIPFFFRYPLEIFFLGLGIGLAFVPVQGRPLDQWIVAFIKSIYSPTQYVWKKSADNPPTISPKTTLAATPTPPTKTPPTPTTQPAQNPNLMTTSTTTIDLATTKTNEPLPVPSSTQGQSRPPKHAKSTSVKPIPQEAIKPAAIMKDPKPLPDHVLPKQKLGVAPTPPKPSLQPDLGKAPTAKLPIPFTPDQPNTIVGLTLNSKGLILDGVLIEIISQGLTIRATKSNKLGQFLFAKALENGLYQIKAEKEGHNFTTYSITLEDRILKPLKIQSQS